MVRHCGTWSVFVQKHTTFLPRGLSSSLFLPPIYYHPFSNHGRFHLEGRYSPQGRTLSWLQIILIVERLTSDSQPHRVLCVLRFKYLHCCCAFGHLFPRERNISHTRPMGILDMVLYGFFVGARNIVDPMLQVFDSCSPAWNGHLPVLPTGKEGCN